MSENFVTAKEACKYYNCSNTTLMRWKRTGLIEIKQFSSKKILYNLKNTNTESNVRNHVIYARVSNFKQSKDLETQIETIKQYCISNGIKVSKIYKDIASGMNENRKSFNEMIDDVIAGKIEKVYISFKDRLTCFGFEYFKNIFKKYDTEIVILDELEESNKTFQEEMTEDLIAIIHHFSMKMYSNRRKKLKEIEKELNCKAFLQDA